MNNAYLFHGLEGSLPAYETLVGRLKPELLDVPTHPGQFTPREVIAPFIERALRNAEEQNVKWNTLTPFLLTRLDELTRALPANTAPALLHYLHRKSYEKARLWLEGRDAENARGSCPR